ncbi:hypothetical protein JAAARDRAFT_39757 [Jaapia argillacea MUCL 33604]|uniref:DDE-1 domain-containing protein n=1 Tax=Jaapia argillacea MUCL 33604 TaxID=933084 RepID=A0A067PDR1_9AGAM|nr:hypothetical protein JAAARDRAFT_39757 [Jaapia argillacea MUCL 33604]
MSCPSFESNYQNIWNMDEKGIQMGVESGDRELVTIIEAVSATGRVLHPSVIYKGAHRDLSWGKENPCHASISHSPNGWTDQELGLKWLQKDFEPKTRTDGY